MPVENSEWPDEGDLADGDSPADLTDPLHHGPPVTHPGLDLEPQPESVEDEKEQGVQEKALQFDPRVREDFNGLLFLGRLTDDFHWMGHEFTIRTLTTGEVLEVGLVHKPYRDTLADVKAYQAAVVAACVVKVDGQPMPLPITNQVTDTALKNRFDYVLKSWFPPLLDVVYEQYLLLEERVGQVMVAMGNPSR